MLLLDHYIQPVLSDNYTKAEPAKLSEQTRTVAQQGTLDFSNFTLAAVPGSTVHLSVVSAGLKSDETVTVSLRQCELVEVAAGAWSVRHSSIASILICRAETVRLRRLAPEEQMAD